GAFGGRDRAPAERQAELPMGAEARAGSEDKSLMRTPLCDEFGIEYPIFGFTPAPEVAAAITNAGGLGVLGAVRYNDPADLADALDWMDKEVDGKPYGVDVVMPVKLGAAGDVPDLQSMIPQANRE